MPARYRIVHTSRYRYDPPVTASFNEARLIPLATAWQAPLESVVLVPQASWHYRYVDYWGTQVYVFEAEQEHRELVVQARSLVEVEPGLRERPQHRIGWDELRVPEVTTRFGEYLVQQPGTQPPSDLAAMAAEIATAEDPLSTAMAVSNVVHEQMSYVPGSTGVATAAAEAWAARSGVCQDYAHLVVGALRHVGMPARYVSGYLHPDNNASIGEPVAGESHAWVEWWVGKWVAHDPTNATWVTDQHVVVGRAREYADVPPIKGIVAGSPVHANLDVEVEITRVA